MKDLEKHREMVIGEPIVTAEEHAPIEMDPVADFEKARAAMEEQMKQLNLELEAERSARAEAEHVNEMLKIQVEATRKEREKALVDLAQAEKKIYSMRRQADKQNERHDRELDSIRKQMHKPILRPCLAIAGFSILSMLIGMAVDQALVASRLGEPLGYGCIGVAALFAGIIWERMGVWCYGSKRIYSTKLGAGNTCKGCGDHS